MSRSPSPLLVTLLVCLLGLTAQDSDIDRLVAELKSPSELRRRVAAHALRAYGKLALEPVEAAGLDAAKVLGIREETEEDREIAAKLKRIRITIDMQDAPLTAIIDYLSEITGLTFRIDRRAIKNPEGETLSFKATDIVLDGALRLMLGPGNRRYVVRGGTVIVTEGEGPSVVPEGRRPVRNPDRRAPSAPLVRSLASDEVSDREEAQAALRRLGFAAERALWDGLDAPSGEVRSRAAEILNWLYTPVSAYPVPPGDPCRVPVRLVAEEALLPALLEKIAAATGEVIVLDARVDVPEPRMTIQYTLPADGMMKLILDRHALVHERVGRVVLVSDELRVARSLAPAWVPAAEAATVNAALKVLEKGGRVSLAGITRTGVGALLGALSGEDHRAARARLVAAAGLWLVGEPGAASTRSLTRDQEARLAERRTLSLHGKTLEESLRELRIEGEVRAGGRLRHRVFAFDRPVREILEALTRPYGLDFRLEGSTVVVDTRERILSDPR